MRVNVTDQALVALVLARAAAADAGRPATVADLLVGLAEEPEGVAGRLLRGTEQVVVRLRGHPRSPRLPALDVAVAWARGEVGTRPIGTGDLLGAALEVGGGELADLLEAVGGQGVAAAADQLPPSPPADPFLRLAGTWGDPQGAGTETFGARPPGETDPALTRDAATALAHARAAGGSALDVLLAVASGTQSDRTARPLPGVDHLLAAARRLRGDAPPATHAGADGPANRRGQQTQPSTRPSSGTRLQGSADRHVPDSRTGAVPRDDAGAAIVVAGAVATADGLVTTTDLVRAAALVGGGAPARLLEAVRPAPSP